MNKFEFHFYTSFINYFDDNWFARCSNVPTLLGFKEWLERLLVIVNKELEKYED